MSSEDDFDPGFASDLSGSDEDGDGAFDFFGAVAGSDEDYSESPTSPGEVYVLQVPGVVRPPITPKTTIPSPKISLSITPTQTIQPAGVISPTVISPQITPISPQIRVTPQVTSISPQIRTGPPQVRITPQFAPISPQVRLTPQFAPISPQIRLTPQFAPISPQVRLTPQFAPISPQIRATPSVIQPTTPSPIIAGRIPTTITPIIGAPNIQASTHGVKANVPVQPLSLVTGQRAPPILTLPRQSPVIQTTQVSAFPQVVTSAGIPVQQLVIQPQRPITKKVVELIKQDPGEDKQKYQFRYAYILRAEEVLKERPDVNSDQIMAIGRAKTNKVFLSVSYPPDLEGYIQQIDATLQ